MKKITIILLSIVLITACKESKESQPKLTDEVVKQMEQSFVEEGILDLKVETAEKKLEELKSNYISETKAFYDNNKPMFIDFLDKETLKKVYLSKFDYYGNLIFLVPFNEKGQMHGEFFDLINDGYYDNGVLNCKNCTLVSSNQPMVFTHNYEFKNTYITKGDIINGFLVGNFKVEMNTEKKIYDSKKETLLIGNQLNTYERIIPRGTGEFMKTDLYRSEYPFNEYGVYDGEITRTFRNDKLPGKNITIKFVADNGKVRQYIKKDHNGNIIDSISNDFKIWKINYEYVKKPGFPIFSDPGSFADLPSLFKDVVDDYSPFRDAFNRTKFKQDIKYSITNSPVVLIGGETNQLTNYQKMNSNGNALFTNYIGLRSELGFYPLKAHVPHDKDQPIKWFNENEEFQSIYKYYQTGITIGKSKDFGKNAPIDTGGPRNILDENGLWSIREKNNKLLYEAYSYIGNDPMQISELGKSYLSNDSLKTQINFYNIGQGFNLFYAAYNVIKGDLLLENNKTGDSDYRFFHLRRVFYDYEAKKLKFNTINYDEFPNEWDVYNKKQQNLEFTLKDIFYGGKYSIITYENYFKGFDIMSKKLSNFREIWVYNNQIKNWEKVNFKEAIELAVSKDNAIRPVYEKSLEEKQEAERKAKEEAEKKAKEEAEKKAEKKAKEEADRIARKEFIGVSWNTVKVAPLFAGCDNKKCSSNKIESFVKEKFNTNILKEEGIEYMYYFRTRFKFDKSGGVVDIKTWEKNLRIEEEIIRVINLLPNKIESPGFNNGREVFVNYTLEMSISLMGN